MAIHRLPKDIVLFLTHNRPMHVEVRQYAISGPPTRSAGTAASDPLQMSGTSAYGLEVRGLTTGAGGMRVVRFPEAVQKRRTLSRRPLPTLSRASIGPG